MEGDFKYLLLKHGKEGARSVFENACEKALKREFPEQAFKVEPNPGDEGIDVFVGDFTNVIDVFQCKFFIDAIDESQKDQVTKSFKTAIESDKFKMKKWVLCLPIALDIEGHAWWSKWKLKRENKHQITIDLWDSADLISLMTKHGVSDEVFDMDERMKINALHTELIEKKVIIRQVLSPPAEVDFSNNIFIAKLKSAKIEEHLEMFERQFYNAEILEKETFSKGVKTEEQELASLKALVLDLWLTQYQQYKHNDDGNELIGRVCQRVEDEDSGSLKTALNANVIDKKGMLHQWANECKLGWIKDYKVKLKEYYDKINNGQGE